ncbi:hypothetical protein PR048_009106 [Dryococelus australis]|uniref:Integrase catalytic domain-containing protein n=1 Tax=Dryococelus australis TaxID=614101 RepID=A0ABQ9HYZ5_9NEOP|nr:hypothetical protein PR048_009106 [Dryococelus australis]
MIRNCPTCMQERQNPRQPFVQSERPSHTWPIVAIDLFKCDAWYLIVTDYYSRYFEICPLSRLTDTAVIGGLKEIFAHFGIPEIVRSDNGSQFTSSNFQSFANTYNFQVITSSTMFRKGTEFANYLIYSRKTKFGSQIYGFMGPLRKVVRNRVPML